MSDASSPRRAARAPLDTLVGDEERLVLDIGSRVCRAGFSGESAPRAIVDALATCRDALSGTSSLWDLNMMMARDERTTRERHTTLVRCLNHQLREVFRDQLMTDPRARSAIVAHSPLLMDAVQHAICEVLLGKLGVPRVSFIDTHVLASVAAGRMIALVVDVGYLETTVMPVYYGRPLRNLIYTTPRAGRRLTEAVSMLIGSDSEPVPPDVAETVKTSALLVSPAPIAGQTVCVSPLDRDAFATKYSGMRAESVPLTVRSARGLITVDGWVRERAAEVLFEPGNEDELSIVDCAVSCILRVPIDTRRDLLSSILLAGGTPMLPGFAARYEASVKAALRAKTLHSSVLVHRASTSVREENSTSAEGLASNVRVLNAPQATDAPAPMPGLPCNLLAWTGASIAGSLQADGTLQVQRDEWTRAQRLTPS